MPQLPSLSRKLLPIMLAAISVLACALLLFSRETAQSKAPRYTNDGRMLLPVDYREWVFLSAGLGMTYEAEPSADKDPAFDNVFVNPAAYRAFVQTGQWPDKTVFVLEIRASQSKGSINTGGHFQTSVRTLAIHVKDRSRFKGSWAFFDFKEGDTSGALIPMIENCYSCHQQHGAVDTTFVQFYPTLLDIAKKKNTITKN